MISFSSSFEVINVVHFVKSEGHVPDPNIFLWIAGYVADPAAVNPNGIKKLSANVLSKIFIKCKPVFSDGPKSVLENYPDCPFLCNLVFDNLILAEELPAKALWRHKACVLVNDNLCEKLFSSTELPATFDENFEVTSVLFFIPEINLFSCKLEKIMFKVLYWVILYWYYIKVKLYIPCEKSEMVSFAFSIMKGIAVFSGWSRFPVNLICCIDLDQYQALVVYLNLLLSSYNNCEIEVSQ